MTNNNEIFQNNTKLVENNSELVKNNSKLLDNYNELREQHSELQEEYDELGEIYAELEESYDELLERYYELLGESFPDLVEKGDHDTVIANIVSFNNLLNEYDPDENHAMETIIGRLSNFQSWYAYWNEEENEYIYAPSKYIGYKDLTPILYKHLSEELDGKETEKVLSTMYAVIEEDDELYNELYNGLVELLDTYNKTPNARFRLNKVDNLTKSNTPNQ